MTDKGTAEPITHMTVNQMVTHLMYSGSKYATDTIISVPRERLEEAIFTLVKNAAQEARDAQRMESSKQWLADSVASDAIARKESYASGAEAMREMAALYVLKHSGSCICVDATVNGIRALPLPSAGKSRG